MRVAIATVVALLWTVSVAPSPDDKGIIGEVLEEGSTVLFKLVDELPEQEVREEYRWLTVISWKYDGSAGNGMPPEKLVKRMLRLEHAIENAIEKRGLCRHAYSRTGNNLKELVYYIPNRDDFMAAFNDALAGHPRYPIEINFYEDPAWEDFEVIRGQFQRGGSEPNQE